MFNKRVVVTGLGLVTPLGNTVASNWAKLLGSQHGIVNLDHYYASKKESLKESKNKVELERLEELNLPQKSNSRIGGVVDFDATGLEGLLDDRLMPKFIKYGVSAAHQALTDSSWFPKSEDDCINTGVCFGSGIGSLMDTVNTYKHLDNGSYNKVSPFFVPRILVNMAAGHITIKYGFRGPNHSVSTACTTGAHSIGDAYRFILHGDAKVMVAGGSESSLNPLSYAGFGRAKSLSTSFNDAPGQASRPFDSKRDGFVIGEGAGAIVLEELEHAKQRGARIYAEIKGYGLSGDAHHITSPPDDARGAYRAMQRALETAQLNPEQLGYINAHATSTPKGDALERLAIERLFGSSAHLRDQKLAVSSSKGAIGHLLGAAGAVESIYTILALYNGVLPPTLNLENPEPSQTGMEINLVPKTSQNADIKYALSNSFGFGGTNASLCFGKFE